MPKSAANLEFRAENYRIINDKLVRNAGAPPLTRDEDNMLITELGRYVESRIVDGLGFVHIPIPGEDTNPSTSILASPNWGTATKLLIIVQNQSGAMIGIFSRTICIDQGLDKGSMLPYISRALDAGYGVLILRPNTNSVSSPVSGAKVPIVGSDSPEIHALCVWETVVRKAENVNFVALLSYGNGASLCKDLLEKQIVITRKDASEPNRIKAFITIEASSLMTADDDSDIKQYVSNLAVNMECNSAAKGYSLRYRQGKLGCISLSLGLPPGSTEVNNVAASISLAIDPVFEYLKVAEASQREVASQFAQAFAKANNLNAISTIDKNPNKEDELLDGGGVGGSSSPKSKESSADSSRTPEVGFFARLFRGSGAKKEDKAAPRDEKLTVDDFDLIKIVGKGAFGKVMLVRKKPVPGKQLTPTELKWNPNQIYAMKVLKKSVVAAKGQVEHTKSEREILCTIKHPFIVCLRYAFQNEEKLYLITDYYNGGTLFFHLRKSRNFTEERARFYAAQLLLALDHLHSQNIIYRDLKLENVLLDQYGNIALTDFGLSKQNIDKTGATTFCGTAEYIAPELLRGKPYGKAVDWWSFGILLFEMIQGRTPFYDKNRKLMFYRIINTEPEFPKMSPEVISCLRGLLTVNEETRLGCKADNSTEELMPGSPHRDEFGKPLVVTRGAKDIINTAFFSVINFEQLWLKQLTPPYQPEVVDILDTKYVPKQYLEAEARDSVDEKKGKPDARDGAEKFDAFTFAGESNM